MADKPGVNDEAEEDLENELRRMEGLYQHEVNKVEGLEALVKSLRLTIEELERLRKRKEKR